MIKACVFDLDGTVLYTLESLRYSINHAIGVLGYPPISVEDTRRYVGNGTRKMIERSLGHYSETDQDRIEIAYKEYLKFFKDNCMKGVVPYEHLPEIIQAMKDDGIKLAVFSNKPNDRTKDNIYGTYGEDLFDLVYGERPGIPLKPEAGGILAVLDELGVKPEETLYFGDSDMDMIAGRRAGCKTVACLWGYRDRDVLEECKPDYFLEKPEDMANFWKDK